MRRGWGAVGAAFSLLFVWGCISDRVLVQTPQGVVVDDDVVARAKGDTESLRGLPFRRDVPLEVMTVEQLEQWLNRHYDRYKIALKQQDYFYHKMGILPPSRDSASTWKGFFGGFAGGVYDPDRTASDGTKGSMILVQDYAWWSKVQLDLIGALTGMDLAYEVFLAHELTHALQDQHLRLDRLLVDVANDDVRMVQKTMLESEGNVIGMAHFAGMHLNDLGERKAFFAFLRYNNLFNAPLLTLLAGKTPSFFSRQSFSQYELGLDWVEQRLDEGEWRQLQGDGGGALAELARAYVRGPGTPGALPASTEQLLYEHKRCDPPLLLLPFVDERELLKATPVGGDVFGALALKHWIERPFVNADAVAAGWGGDHYDVFVDVDDSPVLLWRLLGDSDEDAREIFEALVERFERSLPAFDVVFEDPDRVLLALSASDPVLKGVRITRPERLLVQRRGSRVVVVNGVGVNVDLQALVDELFEQTQAQPADPDALVARAAAAAELERSLEQSLAKAPQPPELSLGDRLVLPRRTMALRLGLGAFVVDDKNSFGPDLEARWGMRDHVELALPGALTLRVAQGPFVFAVGVAPAALPLFDPINGVWSARVLATTTWQASTIAVHLQVESGEHFSVGDLDSATRDRTLRAGLAMRPLPWLVLQPALSLEDRGGLASAQRIVVDTLRLGGVMQRGFVDAPLLELEFIPGLWAYLASSVDCRVDNADLRRGLTIVEQRHAVGLLLYF